MQNFQDPFETRKRSFVSAFSMCMAVPLKYSGFGYSSVFEGSSFNP